MGGYSSLPQLRVPEQPDILEQYAKLSQLRNLGAQNQIQQQSIQSNDIEIQQKQKDIADQQKITDAYIKANGNLSKAADMAAQAGVNPATVIKLKQADMEQQKTLLGLDDAKRAALKSQTDLVGQHTQAILSLPPEQRPAAIQQSVNDLAQQGAIPPEQAQQLLQSAPLDDPTATEKWLKLHSAMSMGAKEQLDLADKQAQQAETNRHNIAEEGKAPTDAVTLLKGGKLHSVLVNKKTGEEVKDLGETRQPSTVNNLMTRSDATDIADAIENGDQPPTLQGLYRNAGPVRAELARRGFPLAKAETDWKAVQKNMASLNGPQQLRLRQSIASASELLDKVDSLYAEWKSLAPVSGFKIANHAALIAMKNLPGRPGAVANALDTQIAELTADLGNIYMGGNSPTDQALQLGAKALKSDWGPDAFEEGIKQAHLNVKIRQNSITHSAPAGVSPDSPYLQQQQEQAAPPAKPAGATHIGIGSADKKKHYLDAKGNDLGLAE